MNIISIIPARMGSSRFPNKPMQKILGIDHKTGLIITDIDKDSSGEKSGLFIGDVILIDLFFLFQYMMAQKYHDTKLQWSHPQVIFEMHENIWIYQMKYQGLYHKK